jgi:hypothetical protein
VKANQLITHISALRRPRAGAAFSPMLQPASCSKPELGVVLRQLLPFSRSRRRAALPTSSALLPAAVRWAPPSSSATTPGSPRTSSLSCASHRRALSLAESEGLVVPSISPPPASSTTACASREYSAAERKQIADRIGAARPAARRLRRRFKHEGDAGRLSTPRS